MRWIVPLLIAVAPVQAVNAQSSDGMSYVLLLGKNSATINGSTDDLGRAKSWRAGGAPLLYVRQNGTAYVIRDAAIIRRAEAIMRPQQELGERQSELGRLQSELGEVQSDLGEAQGRIGTAMANATPRQMSLLGEQMSELGQRQTQLGKQQEALGKRQSELGLQQARLGELAQPQFRALVADAIRRGVAQRVD